MGNLERLGRRRRSDHLRAERGIAGGGAVDGGGPRHHQQDHVPVMDRRVGLGGLAGPGRPARRSVPCRPRPRDHRPGPAPRSASPGSGACSGGDRRAAAGGACDGQRNRSWRMQPAERDLSSGFSGHGARVMAPPRRGDQSQKWGARQRTVSTAWQTVRCTHGGRCRISMMYAVLRSHMRSMPPLHSIRADRPVSPPVRLSLSQDRSAAGATGGNVTPLRDGCRTGELANTRGGPACI